MQECLAVGQKSGAKVPSSWVDDRMTFSDNAPPGMKASMLHDLEAGNRLELDWLTGKVVVARQGARRADAGERGGLCRGEAAPHGQAVARFQFKFPDLSTSWPGSPSSAVARRDAL